SVPFDLYFAGTCDATAATVPPAEVEVVEVAVVELVLDLLLPHPAIARMTSTGTPARARTLIIETKPPEGLSRTVRSRPRKYRSASRTFESRAAADTATVVVGGQVADGPSNGAKGCARGCR